MRVGDYRIIYSISEKEKAVRVLKIAHRRDVYRSL
jgi:mRNA-degrading endonuclease RelE of RelBE toxin-antitoxin system